MKTHLFITATLMLTTAVQAQSGGVITSAPTLEMGQSEMSARLTQLLDEAKAQNEKLQTSLDRMGDPSAMNLPAVQIIKDDIIQANASLKTKDQQRTMMSALTGSEVFTDDAFGLMEPIGATVTKKDGTTVNRDPEKYRMDAAMVAQVKEFREVREKSLKRKETLQQEINEVLKELQDAEDLSSTLKLNAMLTALYGQIEECNANIRIAQADAEMAEKEMVGQARITAKAKTEESNLNNARTAGSATPPTGAGTFPGAGATPIKLPFGRKGSANNPGSSPSTPPPTETDPGTPPVE